MCFIEGAGISGDETASTLHIAHHAQKSAEKKFAAVIISLIILAPPGAAAQGKTRTEVDQETGRSAAIRPELVSETSYPDVNQMFTAQITRLKQPQLAPTKCSQQGWEWRYFGQYS
jgi:hypothetical protein